MRKASGKPKRNVWKDPSPYGTYDDSKGRGSATEWRSDFYQRFTREEVIAILNTDSPYGILGLSDGATADEIKLAFRNKMKIHHPDVGGDTEMAKKIIAAYQHLTGK